MSSNNLDIFEVQVNGRRYVAQMDYEHDHLIVSRLKGKKVKEDADVVIDIEGYYSIEDFCFENGGIYKGMLLIDLAVKNFLQKISFSCCFLVINVLYYYQKQ